MEEYTPAVIRAMNLAQVLAVSQNAIAVEPFHLLQALLQEEEGRPFVMLRQVGAILTKLQNWIVALPQQGDVNPKSIPLHSVSESALDRARQMAHDIALDPTVSSEQLLLTLLIEDERLRREMETLGVEVAELEAQVLNAIQGPPIALEEPLQLDDLTEQMDTARIIDANANRAREALRVIEDYCRFVREDAGLSRELKNLRHELATVLESLPIQRLLAARETLHDVGTSISTTQEQTRYSVREVVVANIKRLQESLRSLEEYAKLENPSAGQTLEQMRYRSYTLERMILFGVQASDLLAEVRLYLLVTGEQCWGPLEWTVREAIAGGVQMIQMREKNLGDRELWARARQLRRWTREGGALFIVNNRTDIARLVEADGVHLGQDELPVKEARRILGADALIGVSTHNLEQAHQAIREGASYIGVGPTFPSQTKQFGNLAGLEFIRQVAAETTLPSFAIGGIKLANLPEVLAAGASRIAVSAALCQSETPQALAIAMRQLLDS